MPSYISNSSYKIKLLILFLFSILVYFVINIAAFKYNRYYYAMLEKDKHIFKRDVRGMLHLMKQEYPLSQHSLDIIFVGNSTTKMHISSAIFQSHNLKIYNFSLLGYCINQYIWMINEAIKAKPKIIVLSMNKPELYYSTSFFYKNCEHQTDIRFSSLNYLKKYAKNRDDYYYLTKYLLSYLVNKNFFEFKGYALTEWMKHQYNKFNLGVSQTKSVRLLYQRYCSYPHTFNSSFEDCTNGDMRIFNDSLSINGHNVITNHPASSFNYSLAAIWDGLLDKIKIAGIQPVIIFIPDFDHHVYEDDTLIMKTLHADIIDLSELNIPDDGWHDTEHLNLKGKEVYSKKLIKMIEPLLKVGFS